MEVLCRRNELKRLNIRQIALKMTVNSIVEFFSEAIFGKV